jgi:hypothetical protein
VSRGALLLSASHEPKAADASIQPGMSIAALDPVSTCQLQRYGERSGLTYVKHALLHPYNLPLLVVVMTVGAISGNLAGLFLAVLAELVLLTTVSRLRFFRRHIQEILEQADRAEAARARATVLLKMDEKHRQELEILEALADQIRGNLNGAAIDDCLGLGRLIGAYVRLAIAYRKNNESLNAANRQMIEQEIKTLETVADHATDRTRALATRRLEIARRRADRWDRTRDDLDAIVHQLAMIRELIHLMHEQSTTAVNRQETTVELDRFIADLEGSAGTIREIAELAMEEPIDHHLLELGRAHAGAAG